MKLKLEESIRANGVQHLPPAVVDTKEIGVSDIEAQVLVRRGTAELEEDEAPAESDEQRQAREAAEAKAAEEARVAAEAEAEAKAKADAEAAAQQTAAQPQTAAAAPAAPAKTPRKR